jgi:ankyrin repeat protein
MFLNLENNNVLHSYYKHSQNILDLHLGHWSTTFKLTSDNGSKKYHNLRDIYYSKKELNFENNKLTFIKAFIYPIYDIYLKFAIKNNIVNLDSFKTFIENRIKYFEKYILDSILDKDLENLLKNDYERKHIIETIMTTKNLKYYCIVDTYIEKIYKNVNLRIAAKTGNLHFFNIFLSEGAHFEGKNNLGENSLFIASKYGNIEIVKLLLDRGANINATNNDGNTSLMISILENRLEIVKLLLDRGANTDIINNDGYSSIMISLLDGTFETTQLFINRGVTH